MMEKFKKIIVMLMSILLFLPGASAYGLNKQNGNVRVGLYYGTTVKNSYSITGKNLALYEGDRLIWESGSDQIEVSRTADGDALLELEGGDIFFRTDQGETYGIDSDERISLESQDGILAVNGQKYRDGLNFILQGSGIAAINLVEEENYLKGVIAKEMPASWPEEALKAQAVVARNYLATNQYKHQSQAFNVCATTHCQVYGGYAAETASTNRAVERTQGELIYYKGSPAEGYFHSTSGGRTENSENVWNNALPYLLGVDDPYSVGNPYDEWTLNMSLSSIKLLLANNGINIGNIRDVAISKTSQNGRALALTIYGTSGNHVLEKDRIRIFFGANNLKSTYFTLEGGAKKENLIQIPENDGSLNSIYKSLNALIDQEGMDQTSQGGDLIFKGKGYGHGVGMSQYGAKKMAEEGYNYKEILKHYFTNVDIY